MKIFKLSLTIIVSLFMLSGCYNQPGLTKDTSYNRTKSGALLGAVAGAVAGYNSKGKHKNRRAAIGALAGAVLGGGVGYYLDKQANEIANALGTGVENDPLAALDPRRDIIVSKTPHYVKIMFRDRMMFASGSSILQSNARFKVNKVARLLERYPQTIVGVAGFTDNKGSLTYNQRLSQRRASSVANILAVNSYPKTKGCAYRKAIAPNNTATNRALNRRVEVYLFPNASHLSDPCVS